MAQFRVGMKGCSGFLDEPLKSKTRRSSGEHFKQAISTGTNPPVSPPYCSYSLRIGMQDAAQIRARDVIEHLTALESLRSRFE